MSLEICKNINLGSLWNINKWIIWVGFLKIQRTEVAKQRGDQVTSCFFRKSGFLNTWSSIYWICCIRKILTYMWKKMIFETCYFEKQKHNCDMIFLFIFQVRTQPFLIDSFWNRKRFMNRLRNLWNSYQKDLPFTLWKLKL